MKKNTIFLKCMITVICYLNLVTKLSAMETSTTGEPIIDAGRGKKVVTIKAGESSSADVMQLLYSDIEGQKYVNKYIDCHIEGLHKDILAGKWNVQQYMIEFEEEVKSLGYEGESAQSLINWTNNFQLKSIEDSSAVPSYAERTVDRINSLHVKTQQFIPDLYSKTVVIFEKCRAYGTSVAEYLKLACWSNYKHTILVSKIELIMEIGKKGGNLKISKGDSNEIAETKRRVANSLKLWTIAKNETENDFFELMKLTDNARQELSGMDHNSSNYKDKEYEMDSKIKSQSLKTEKSRANFNTYESALNIQLDILSSLIGLNEVQIGDKLFELNGDHKDISELNREFFNLDKECIEKIINNNKIRINKNDSEEVKAEKITGLRASLIVELVCNMQFMNGIVKTQDEFMKDLIQDMYFKGNHVQELFIAANSNLKELKASVVNGKVDADLVIKLLGYGEKVSANEQRTLMFPFIKLLTGYPLLNSSSSGSKEVIKSNMNLYISLINSNIGLMSPNILGEQIGNESTQSIMNNEIDALEVLGRHIHFLETENKLFGYHPYALIPALRDYTSHIHEFENECLKICMTALTIANNSPEVMLRIANIREQVVLKTQKVIESTEEIPMDLIGSQVVTDAMKKITIKPKNAKTHEVLIGTRLKAQKKNASLLSSPQAMRERKAYSNPTIPNEPANPIVPDELE